MRLFAETRGFLSGRPVKAKPSPDGQSVLFLRGEAKGGKLKLYEFRLANRETRELLTPETVLQGAEETLSAEERARRERMRLVAGGFTDYQFDPTNGDQLLLPLSGKLYLFTRSTRKVRELKTGPGVLIDPKWSPTGKQIAYVRDHDVRLYDLASDQEWTVTTGGTEAKPHGEAEFVAQEEMGRLTGYWFSPDGTQIVFEEYDTAGVETWYVADASKPDRAPQTQFYPRPGKANVRVRVGIADLPTAEDLTSKAPKWIEWNTLPGEEGQTFPYLANVIWSKHGPLTLVLQTRRQDRKRFVSVDPKSGALAVYDRSHTDAAWTNLRSDEPRFLPGGTYLHVLEVANGDELRESKITGEHRPIVPATLGLHEIEVVAVRGERIFFQATKSPGQMHLFQVTRPTNWSESAATPTPLSHGEGMFGMTLSKDASFWVESCTTLRQMPTLTVRNADGTALGVLPSVAIEPPFQPNVTVQKLGDGLGYYTAIVRPQNFQSGKKYPVLVDVYGGPRHITVLHGMRAWLRDQWLADQGFIVVAVDNRGTPGRGRDWERAVYRKFGSVPLEDQVAGLAALGKSFPELDLQRVGIVGWSFGGYMSAQAVLKRPDVFHAAVAGAPVTDWEDYDTHYTERYMGLLPEDQAAYADGSLLPAAKSLKRPLLLVHGTADDNVYFRHSLRLADALFKNGQDFDVLPLAAQTHMVADPLATERLWIRISQFFRKQLGEPK
ncbi:dipeptidyl peptidase iv : Peptidase, S9B (Dipeptidyl peptidase IV) subfamily OS=Myxococcus xanthus (strain DK 1622) GN=MXAN_6038 PE=4 SV=1: DPPIV_N: Peptidase_S9 [Tuwongella immobilis]|uniref:Peptidase S9 prolyl oligopeptidase catalytic domain-containing protein n=2 Tax=Tuwongella immobilis TaxID=692036 RepID=A0A6C2YKC9_9BACT|nr:dipeptidyl peptidase iv : Peptidase, S9B (Dipeptidyl peptidase IV) subfamily OS=Myxococcus xanthus (strain DK 1622) GN=MXAN_6038 PE=4 SV=1: DPPIV_N: Peptidase_S9 [Tuwongella immobilis]VTR98786.1 dipeptidyl peptidase iv : Peptidase, S9B (Dipeptidyl peptidase IV) subfamily OS=Myxococcus xanthus (strain DK 1622) GN=MXAN_6038 PE=4 SV=1: DPPIV_N: Peptidase_S9 [Tuwongella immobilis]